MLSFNALIHLPGAGAFMFRTGIALHRSVNGNVFHTPCVCLSLSLSFASRANFSLRKGVHYSRPAQKDGGFGAQWYDALTHSRTRGMLSFGYIFHFSPAKNAIAGTAVLAFEPRAIFRMLAAEAAAAAVCCEGLRCTRFVSWLANSRRGWYAVPESRKGNEGTRSAEGRDEE